MRGQGRTRSISRFSSSLSKSSFLAKSRSSLAASSATKLRPQEIDRQSWGGSVSGYQSSLYFGAFSIVQIRTAPSLIFCQSFAATNYKFRQYEYFILKNSFSFRPFYLTILAKTFAPGRENDWNNTCRWSWLSPSPNDKLQTQMPCNHRRKAGPSISDRFLHRSWI
ncbi:hypothetical protein FQZ97_776960 [compost metagenome]